MLALGILLGFVALIGGAELLVRGAAELARAVGMPPLIIGLTVVAFGTSTPELAVSVKAAVSGQADIALGNVVGSNTFNVLFILGISALVAPLVVSSQLIRLDVPVMIGVSALTWVLARDGAVGRVEGAVLVAALCAYTALLIYLGMRSNRVAATTAAEPPAEIPRRRLGWSVLWVLIGLGLLVLGSNWLVNGAVALARLLGVSELVIGLTIVAAGTSMPELATSVLAAIRGQREIAVGNVVGSNIYNLLAVLGGTALVSEQGVRVADAALRFDVPVMLAVSAACLPIFFTGGRISRWEGGLFLGYYVAYVVFLVLSAMRHEASATFNAAMIWFIIPLTTLGIAVSVVAWLPRRRDRRVKPADGRNE